MGTNSDFGQAADLFGRLVRAANFALDYWWLWLALGALVIVALKIRAQHALIASLDERADAVRAFSQREHDVIRDVLDGRVDALEAANGAIMQTGPQMAQVLQNVFSVSEKYPQLASGEHYRTLRADLIRLEDRITAARRFYNLAVEELNAVKRAFPGNMIDRRDPSPVREKFSLGERRAECAEPVKISF